MSSSPPLFPVDTATTADSKRRRLIRHNPSPSPIHTFDSIDQEQDNDELFQIEDPNSISEEEDGEDLLENAESDYRPMETLDYYDSAQLDDREYELMDVETRRKVEEELTLREEREGRVQQMLKDDDEMELDDAHRQRLLRPITDQQYLEEEEEMMNLENFNVPLREWIATERPRNEIKRRFKHFLKTFKDKDNSFVYTEKIQEMAQSNHQSLDIEIGHIIQKMSMMAAWIVEAPRDMLSLLDQVAFSCVLDLFPYYSTIHDEIYVRIVDLPGTERIRDLRTAHLNFLIKVSGVVTRRTSVFPQLKLVKLNCPQCGTLIGPYTQQLYQEIEISYCSECDYKGKKFPVNVEHTIYRNYQRITLQESPSSVPPGRVPRSKDVILLADLIDRVRPGDEIAVTGIYCNIPNLNQQFKDNFPVFQTIIEANHIETREDAVNQQLLSTEDKKKILKLSKHPKIAQLIINSMAPSIYGHFHVKTALAMALFGGKSKTVKNTRIRGDINVLLIGDPGTAKSQFLKFTKNCAPRAVYTTGKGASAVGLTAAVTRDMFTKEWVLQGGALVLADKGVCLIDEFDKMNEQDRTSIHEAMEQQSISVSKAGIVTSLQARCSVIAAANPIHGRYNPTRTFSENVELTDPILQRFDILCVLQDQVDPVNDERLADFVVSSHIKCMQTAEMDVTQRVSQLCMQGEGVNVGQTEESGMILEPALLRKYILYARTFIDPVVSNDVDTRKVETFYAQLRKASQHTGAVPIAVRHIESLFRMAEAHARMHLRESVTNDDMDTAIRVMTESLCTAQKFSFQRQWRRLFRRYLTNQQDNNLLLLFVLEELVQSADMYLQLKGNKELKVPCSDLLERAKLVGIYDLSEFYQSPAFLEKGFRLDPSNEYIHKLL